MQDSDELIAVDLATQTDPLARRHRPDAGRHLRHRTTTRRCWSGLTGSDGVQVFDVGRRRSPRRVGKIPTGKGAHAFRAAGDGRSVFVSNRVANTISRIDLQTLQVSRHLPGARRARTAWTCRPTARRCYVTSRWAKKLSVIDLTTRQGGAAGQRGPVAARRLDARPCASARRAAAGWRMLSLALLSRLVPAGAVARAQSACAKPVYLTFDTGHMGVAPLVAEVLKRQDVRVTFFAAAERTQTGGDSLDNHWAPWWKARAAEGHEFASHTYDHAYWRGDVQGRRSRAFASGPSAGAFAGREFTWTRRAVLRRTSPRRPTACSAITGKKPLPLFRAPGGKTSPQAAGGGRGLRLRARGLGAGRLPRRRAAERDASATRSCSRRRCDDIRAGRHPAGAPGHLVAQGPVGAGRCWSR